LHAGGSPSPQASRKYTNGPAWPVEGIEHNVGMPPRSPSQRWSNWNLLLLVPLLMLITPVYNRIEPRVLGFPFFYWYQFLWIPIAVLCTIVVYLKTQGDRR
jgi:hypothetical protein